MTNPFRMKDLQKEWIADADTTSFTAFKSPENGENTQNVRISHPGFENDSNQARLNDEKVKHQAANPGASGGHNTDSRHILGSEDSKELDNIYDKNHIKLPAPPNPFAKTLATLEWTEDQVDDVSNLDNAGRSSAIPTSMDVDSFTQLLLTGDDSKSIDTVTKARNAPLPGLDSTSSTETSSISRQSLQEPISDTPRSSYDQGQYEDWIDRSERHKPPPPPKSKHGKTIPAKGPQIVSFDDFELSIPSQMESTSTTKPQEHEAVRKTSHNKPLPPPPPSELQKDAPDLQQSETKETGHLSRSGSEKKVAPPLPLARRSTVTRRSRTNTVSSIASVNEETPSSYPPSISESISSPKIAPPPPPTRRHGSSSNIQSPSFSDSSKAEYMSPLMAERTPSSSQVSLASPPPPPTRRRSSKASMEAAQNLTPSASHSRRSSSEAQRPSFDSQRRVSTNPIIEESDMETSRHTLPHRASSASGKSILADMDAFAKELENLRSNSNDT